MYFKTFEQFKDYKFLADKTRHEMNIFDVDDTLVVTKSAIKVTDHKTGKTTSLTPQQFNEYEQATHHSVDFDDFADIEILKAGKIVDWVMDILKATLKKSKAVGIITARADADLIYDFLIHHGVDINPDFIFAVNDPESGFTGSVSNRKKQALTQLVDNGFTNFKFFDDSKENLEIAKSLEKDLDGIKIKTRLIKQKWIPKI